MARIAVSNLAWPTEDSAEALSVLSKVGVQGVEVAPGRIAPWDGLDRTVVHDYRSTIEDAGLVVSSMQAIFFMVPTAQLLSDTESFQSMTTHLRRVGELAAQLGASLAVFGAPKNRSRGDLSVEAANDMVRIRLRSLGDVASDVGLTIAVEPVPEAYGGDILTTANEVIDVVSDVDHPAIRVHLDTGCVLLGGGIIGDAVRRAEASLVHFHAAEPNLGDFAAPVARHEDAAAALPSRAYEGWVAVEMLGRGAGQIVAMETAARFAVATYGTA